MRQPKLWKIGKRSLILIIDQLIKSTIKRNSMRAEGAKSDSRIRGRPWTVTDNVGIGIGTITREPDGSIHPYSTPRWS